ncbi:hypothetical protein GCM10009760_61750 [Kitasatospora kazusensis]|uniref:Uncharacterized protein n=1 Tax=Kitasatospora kazusensis TaxID=407974 RepID=A0ABN3ABU0_9ACTN
MPRSKDRTGGPRPQTFTLWREVAVAYVAPALTAGLGGLAGGRADLTVAACTSIAGTSAVVALLTGAWLQRHRRRPRPWTLSLPRAVLALGLAVGAAAVAGLLGLLAADWLPAHTGLPDPRWLDRLRTDLPVSAALAAAIVSWRWRGTRQTRRRP